MRPAPPRAYKDGDFLGDTFFGGARARCRTPYLRHAFLASLLELFISAAPLRSPTRQLGLRKVCQQRFVQSLGGLGVAGSLPEGLGKVFANNSGRVCVGNFTQSAARDVCRHLLGGSRGLVTECHIFTTTVVFATWSSN